jgi:hypothetical protein
MRVQPVVWIYNGAARAYFYARMGVDGLMLYSSLHSLYKYGAVIRECSSGHWTSRYF